MNTELRAIHIVEVIALMLAVAFIGYYLALGPSSTGSGANGTGTTSNLSPSTFIAVNCVQIFISAYLGHRMIQLLFKNEELERYQREVLRSVMNIMSTDNAETAKSTTKQSIMNIVGEIPARTTRTYLDRVEKNTKELFKNSSSSYDMAERVGAVIDSKLRGKEMPIIEHITLADKDNEKNDATS